VNQTAPIFGKYGSYVINVPPGQYMKAWSGNKPLLLGEGTHVRHDRLFRLDKDNPDTAGSFDAARHLVNESDNYIHQGNVYIIRVLPGKFAAIVLKGKPELLHPRDKPYVFDSPFFAFDSAKGFINQSENYIAHGNFHQLRIPPGKLAKVVINNIPKLLSPTEDNKPYIIDTPSLRFDEKRDFVNATDNYISHETIHLVRVPPGQFAKVIVDGIPKLLSPTEDNKPHTFKTANFQFNPRQDYVDQSTPYITHGIRHILRLPKGAIAKAWYGDKPVLLEKTSQNDIDLLDFEDPQFRLEEIKRGGQTYQFLSADEKLIVHGSIKRVITPINELAIINKNGKLDIVQGRYDTDSATESVIGFFDTSVQTLEFPSKRVKDKRVLEKNVNDRIIYDVYTTSDSVEVGLKLLVAFCVPDVENAKKALIRFKNMENIAEHIEGVIRSDMTRIIKQYTSQRFSAPSDGQEKQTSGYQPEYKEHAMTDGSSPMPFAPTVSETPSGPSAPPPPKTYLEQAEAILKYHLESCGIILMRMTIEETKILDADLTKKMSEQALTTAKTNADLAIVEQRAMIAKAQAEQAKDVAIIEQSQLNESRVKGARSLLEAADFEAKARERKAEGDARAIERMGEAEAKAMEVKGTAQNTVLQKQAELYEGNPKLFELEITKAKFKALAGVNITVTSQEFSNLFNIPGFSLFGSPSKIARLPASINKDLQEEKEAIVLEPSCGLGKTSSIK